MATSRTYGCWCLSLIPDLLDGGTVRPLLPGIKALWNVGVRALEVLLDWGHEEVSRGVDSHQTPEVVGAGLGVEVAPGSPGRVLGIDSLDELLRENVVMVNRTLDQEHVAHGHGEPQNKHLELRFSLQRLFMFPGLMPQCYCVANFLQSRRCAP